MIGLNGDTREGEIVAGESVREEALKVEETEKKEKVSNSIGEAALGREKTSVRVL